MCVLSICPLSSFFPTQLPFPLFILGSVARFVLIAVLDSTVCPCVLLIQLRQNWRGRCRPRRAGPVLAAPVFLSWALISPGVRATRRGSLHSRCGTFCHLHCQRWDAGALRHPRTPPVSTSFNVQHRLCMQSASFQIVPNKALAVRIPAFVELELILPPGRKKP